MSDRANDLAPAERVWTTLSERAMGAMERAYAPYSGFRVGAALLASDGSAALDDIPALAITDEDAFRLSQGRPIVLLPRQVETLRARLKPRTIAGQDASRTVLATLGGRASALCEMRAGRLSPVRVFHLDQGDPDVDHA